MKNITNRRAFRIARKRLGLTCAQLAVKMNISRTEIMSYEIGAKQIPSETIVRLFEAGIFMYTWGNDIKDSL